MTRPRRLVLVRHAKAVGSGGPGTSDHERPLTDRGRRQGSAVGALLVQRDLVPDLVLSSDAARARQTWERAESALPAPVPLRLEPRLYEASAESLVNLVAEVAADVGTVLLVGHEPVLSTVAVGLAGPGSDEQMVAQVRAHLPTAGVVVLELEGNWPDVGAGRCRLAAVLSTTV